MIRERDLRAIAGDSFADIVNFQELKEFIFGIGEVVEDEKMKRDSHQIAEKLWEKWFESEEDYNEYIGYNSSFEVRFSEGGFKAEWEEDEAIGMEYITLAANKRIPVAEFEKEVK